MSVNPPHGMTEADYEAIEAAVTETVRGRWFLAEFARRNRLAETHDILDALSRIETTMTAGFAAKEMAALAPPADPSIRLLVQRIKEIAGHLAAVAQDMREDGIEERFAAAVDLQGRAVASLMRGGAPEPRPQRVVPLESARPLPAPEPARTSVAEATPAVAQPQPAPEDPRLAVLSRLDGMPLAEKLALFA